MAMNSKKCNNCHQEKDLILFRKFARNADGYLDNCKECMNLPEVKKMLRKKTHTESYKRSEAAEMQRIKKETRLLEAPIKKELAIRKRRERQRLYRLNNLDKKRKIDKNYREKNKPQRNIKDKERKARDPQYRLTVNMRVRLNKAIENGQKMGSAVDDLGCSIEFLKSYLESLFQPGMTWDNYGKGAGKWQIDHIKALCLFDLTNRNELLKAVHYTNLQPLWYEDHLNKTVSDVAKAKVA